MLDYLYKIHKITTNTKVSWGSKVKKSLIINNYLQDNRHEVVKEILDDPLYTHAFYEMFSNKYLDTNYDKIQLEKINKQPLLRLLRLIINTSRYMCLLTAVTLKDNLIFYNNYFNDDDNENDKLDLQEEDSDYNNNEIKELKSLFLKRESTISMSKQQSFKNNYLQEDLKNKEIGYYLFLNSYNKAYKAFVSTVNHLDEYFFDLNSAVVAIEEELSIALNQKKSRVTFSVYRILMHSWFNLVLTDLFNFCPENDINNASSFNCYDTFTTENFKDLIYNEFPEFSFDTLRNDNKKHKTTVVLNKESFNYQITNKLSVYSNYHPCNNANKKSTTPTSLIKSIKSIPYNYKVNKEKENSEYAKLSVSDSFMRNAFFYLSKRILGKSLEKFIEKNYCYNSNTVISLADVFEFMNHSSNNNNNNNLKDKLNLKSHDKLNQFLVNNLFVEWFDEFSLLQDILNSFIDCSCTEINVFRLNLSNFKGKLYEGIEETIVKLYNLIFTNVFKFDLESFKDFINNEDLYKSLPKCSKKKIEDTTVSSFLKNLEKNLQQSVYDHVEQGLRKSSIYIKEDKESNKEKDCKDHKLNEKSSSAKCKISSEQLASELKKYVAKYKLDSQAKNFLSKAVNVKSVNLQPTVKLLLENLNSFIKRKIDGIIDQSNTSNSIYHKDSNSLNYFNNFIQNNVATLKVNNNNSSIFSSFTSNHNSSFSYNSNNNNNSSSLNVNLNVGSTLVSQNSNTNLNININNQQASSNNNNTACTNIKDAEIENFTYYIIVNWLFESKEKYNYINNTSRILRSLDYFLDYDQDLFKINDDSVVKELKRRNILALISGLSKEEMDFIEDFRNELHSRDELLKLTKSKLLA